MPSFDITSKINFAELDNAVNNTQKAIAQRFDFRGSPVELTVDRKEKKLDVVAEDATKVRNVIEMFRSAAGKRGLDQRAFDWGEPEATAAGRMRVTAKLRDGLESEKAKEISRLIKDSKLKVQPSIQGEELRVTAKQIDDLQAVQRLVLAADVGVPLQFGNYRS
ncbi:MAG TPA: YajQ family cyclic di-GMP-binding protein [Phycisphaerales bacterium]|nr:YajQ family cyclic di-GMP-binding protein [Phycisphaerales bacterium]